MSVVRDLIYVSSLAQMSAERADVTDLHDGLETYIALDAQAKVVDSLILLRKSNSKTKEHYIKDIAFKLLE